MDNLERRDDELNQKRIKATRNTQIRERNPKNDFFCLKGRKRDVSKREQEAFEKREETEVLGFFNF